MTGYESKRAAAQAKLAQPAQEPVAWLCKPDENGMFSLPTADKACEDCFPVYTAPLQRPWVGLTDEERDAITSKVDRAVNAMTQPAQKPVAWMNNKDFEPIRVRIMQEAYELAGNDAESYNAIKVMCGDVQRMLPPKRPWVGLTEEEVNNFLNAVWPREATPEDYIKAIEAKLKEKNCG